MVTAHGLVTRGWNVEDVVLDCSDLMVDLYSSMFSNEMMMIVFVHESLMCFRMLWQRLSMSAVDILCLHSSARML
jgi:hypothetical protein